MIHFTRHTLPVCPHSWKLVLTLRIPGDEAAHARAPQGMSAATRGKPLPSAVQSIEDKILLIRATR